MIFFTFFANFLLKQANFNTIQEALRNLENDFQGLCIVHTEINCDRIAYHPASPNAEASAAN